MSSDDLSIRLRQARTAWGLTQHALAAEIGKPRQVLGYWEQGLNVPRLDHLILLADVLEVSLDWLAGRSDEGGPRPPATGSSARAGDLLTPVL